MTTFPHEGDVCGYVLYVSIGTDPSSWGKQKFYYCVAHKDYASIGAAGVQTILYEEIDPFIVCFLCHRNLRSVAYIEQRIVEEFHT